MDYVSEFKLPCNPQVESPLLNGRIPGEIRDRIFTFALTCYESPKTWDRDSSFVRPEYNAPFVADTALLRTCQVVYTQNWFRPWISAVHTFYLAWPGRRPDQVTTASDFQQSLDRLFDTHGKIEVSHVRVFAQLCSLEVGVEISEILDMEHFFPQKITICVRHHDWWSWEDDDRLSISADWVDVCRFPDSVNEICMEIESLKRKKGQIDWVAEEMVKGWHFCRVDGTIMSANREDMKVNLWSGSSTWEGWRWVRDESKPGTLEYYVKTITWRPNANMTERPDLDSIELPESLFPEMNCAQPAIPVLPSPSPSS